MPPKTRRKTMKTPDSAKGRATSKKKKRSKSPRGGYSAARACTHTAVDVGKVVAVPFSTSNTGMAMVRKNESDNKCFYTEA